MSMRQQRFLGSKAKHQAKFPKVSLRVLSPFSNSIFSLRPDFAGERRMAILISRRWRDVIFDFCTQFFLEDDNDQFMLVSERNTALIQHAMM